MRRDFGETSRGRAGSANRDDNISELLIGERAGSKVIPSLLRAGGKISQFIRTECCNCFPNALRVDARGLQRFAGWTAGKESLNRSDVFFARSRGARHGVRRDGICRDGDACGRGKFG